MDIWVDKKNKYKIKMFRFVYPLFPVSKVILGNCSHWIMSLFSFSQHLVHRENKMMDMLMLWHR